MSKTKTLKSNFKIGEYAEVSPDLTHLDRWVKGKIIDLIDKPFLGLEVAVQDKKGNIFYGELCYFKLAK